MTWWVIVGTGHEPGFTHLRVFASTNNADHLWMSWATYRPTQQEIWRIVRGKRVFCGYKYIWDTPNIAEQTDPGDTLIHRFYITGLEAGSEVWYYLNAPYGPTDREIQGPLMHVHLLKPATWTTRAYFASKTMGMFKTSDFSGPGGPQPTWIPDNAGLPFLDLKQACPDPWDPYHRRFVLCHGDAYRMDNFFLEDPATATRVLANWEAVALTNGLPGDMGWITGSPNFAGHFYILWRTLPPNLGSYCLKTEDYGETWTAHAICLPCSIHGLGNIMAGDLQGQSAWPPGHVLYCCITWGSLSNPDVFLSTDEGETWTRLTGYTFGISYWDPLLYVDPSDQGILYIGTPTAGDDLWRTLDHGNTWAEVDGAHHLGIRLTPLGNYAVMGTRQSDPATIRVLRGSHVWQSSDFGLIWSDQGPTQYTVRHLHFRDDSPDFLYLARIIDAPVSDGLYANHVLFVTTDAGSNMFGKAGEHPAEPDGGGDSIPRLCGGAAYNGILTLP